MGATTTLFRGPPLTLTSAGRQVPGGAFSTSVTHGSHAAPTRTCCDERPASPAQSAAACPRAGCAPAPGPRADRAPKGGARDGRAAGDRFPDEDGRRRGRGGRRDRGGRGRPAGPVRGHGQRRADDRRRPGQQDRPGRAVPGGVAGRPGRARLCRVRPGPPDVHAAGRARHGAGRREQPGVPGRGVPGAALAVRERGRAGQRVPGGRRRGLGRAHRPAVPRHRAPVPARLPAEHRGRLAAGARRRDRRSSRPARGSPTSAAATGTRRS